MALDLTMSPTIIGLHGAAGTGKSTIAHELVRLYGFTRLAFADPLKAMLQVLLAMYGMPANQIVRHIDGDLKEQPCAALEGLSCRYALQTLGTEWGRLLLRDTLWCHHLGQRISALSGSNVRVVVDDVRMDNEAEYLLNQFGLGVEIWKVQPYGDARRSPGTHASERGLSEELINDYIRHNFTMSSLALELDAKMQARGIERQGIWRE